MRRLIISRWLIGLLILNAGCSSSKRSEEMVERARQATFSQIEDIKGGRTSSLHAPSPSLIEGIVSDAACAGNIKSLFLDVGDDLSDPRYGGIRQLPKLESVFFYCTLNTDTFLSRIAGMGSLEAIETELADVSDAGMKHVAACPNLVKLVLYGGAPSVGNAGLAELEGHKHLEALELINTSVSDDGLSVLSTLPNLKTLVLYRDAFRDVRLTNSSLKHLQNLTQLEELELSGGWASGGLVERLRSLLPNCEIADKGVH